MTKEIQKEFVLRYLEENYTDLTPITLKEIAAAVKLTDESQVMKVLEGLKAEGSITVLEPMHSGYGTEVIIHLAH